MDPKILNFQSSFLIVHLSLIYLSKLFSIVPHIEFEDTQTNHQHPRDTNSYIKSLFISLTL
jgi:hypothetical protein